MLLLVITVSLVSVQALQLRKSSDSEQTLRAYYAAEAGVEDAVSRVLSGQITPTTYNNQCNTPATFAAGTVYDAPGAATWTCQIVIFSGNPTGKLDRPDSAKTVDPGNAAYRSVIVEWNQSSNAAASYTNPASSLTTGNFPSAAAYSANPFVPPLEMSILRYPTGAFAARDVATATDLQNIVLVPAGAVSSPKIRYPQGLGAGPDAADCGQTSRIYNVGSQSLTGYNCYAVITGFRNTQNYLFRLRSRYDASAYRMTFMSGPNGNGATVAVPDGTATIDVTAKAGDTFRRIISKLPLVKGAEPSLNYVIYSDTNICKNFTVTDNDVPPGTWPPSC